MAASKRDYYEVLGVSRDADAKEIRSAYRKLARQHHPDVSDAPDAHQTFQEIGEAYSVLSDDQKKSHYDQFGHDAPMGGGHEGGIPDIFDLFRTVVGGFGFEDETVRRGADVNYELGLTLADAATGMETEIAVSHFIPCETCEGQGAAPGSAREQCATCRGQGRVRYQQQAMFMTISQQGECPDCQGMGVRIPNPCDDCSGTGRKRQTEKFQVEVPPGVEHGQRVRYAASGDAGPLGSPSGDLYVHIRVEPHDFLVRRGDDLACKVPIDFTQAVLGDVFEIPGLLEDLELETPPGTQHGEAITIRGQGMPRLRRPNKRGDLHVLIRIDIPRKLSKKQRELVLKLADASDIEITPPESGIRKKIGEVLGG